MNFFSSLTQVASYPGLREKIVSLLAFFSLYITSITRNLSFELLYRRHV